MHPEALGIPGATCENELTDGVRDENENVVLRGWLATDTARLLLKKIAGDVIRDITVRGLWGAVPGFGRSKAPLFDEAVEEICSELVLFLCERTVFIKAIIATAEPRSERYIKAAFINKLIDRVRCLDSDPRRYLYKRALDCCRNCEDIWLSEGPSGGRFLSIEPATFHAAPLADEDFQEIPFSETLARIRDAAFLGKKRVLLPLAIHFATCAAHLLGKKDVGVAVRDFISWLSLHADLKSPVEEGFETASHVEPTAGEKPSTVESPDVIGWAHCFASRLSRKEAGIFYLYYARDFNLVETAAAMGLSGPSGVHYHLQNAVEKCRYFIRDLPWVSFEDFDESVFREFQETLFDILKNYAPEPYEQYENRDGVNVEMDHAES
jgi:hypothetical protein